jgi:hypothetical protein
MPKTDDLESGRALPSRFTQTPLSAGRDRSGREAIVLGDRERDKTTVTELADRLDSLQRLFYADGATSCWSCCGAWTPAAKHVARRLRRQGALGLRTVGEAPTEEERAHDPWWRIHHAVPATASSWSSTASHYEDVLVPVVRGQLKREQVAQRYQQINDFERMLHENGTVICKFMLHISKDEQRRRLQERLDDATKH